MRSIVYSIFILGISLFSTAYAIGAPQNLQSLESSDTTISLDWDDTEDAMGYYIYYGTESGVDDGYEVEGIDLIEQSDFILSGLNPETSYFISVSSVDEFGSESDYSLELTQSTLKKGTTSEISNFRISGVEVVNQTTLEFKFSTSLDTDPSATRAFILEEKDSKKEVSIDLTQINENNEQNVIVLLGEELKSNTEYKVTVLEIRDVNGSTIESGIDAFVGFSTEDFNPPVEETSETPLESAPDNTPAVVVDDNSVSVTTPDSTVMVDEGTVSVDTPNTTVTTTNSVNDDTVNQGNAGSNISTDTLGNTTKTAGNTEKLPQAGPEHWMLLFVALMLSAGVYGIYYRKNIFMR